MTEQQQAAMRQALEALEYGENAAFAMNLEGIKANLRRALERQARCENVIVPGGGYAPPVVLEQQPADGPVAKYIGEGNDGSLVQLYEDVKKGTNFYTRPQPAVPAYTADQIYQAWHKTGIDIAGVEWTKFAAALAAAPEQEGN